MPLADDGRHDLDAMLREITAATRIVLVCNPNNPTATAVPLAEIEEFAAQVPRHVALIVDEAYVEFNLLQDPDDSLDLLKRHTNVVLLRTFSKVYGLCGLRVGYALVLGGVPRRGRPHPPAVLGQRACAGGGVRGAPAPGRGGAPRGAHGDRAGARRVRAARARACDQREPGQLLWVAVDDEEGVLAGLQERGVIVRGGSALGDPGHLRVTYGTRAENDRFLAALDDVLNKK